MKVGRPKKPHRDRLSETVQIHLTKLEREAAARMAGVTPLATWMRSIVIQHMTDVICNPQKEYRNDQS